MTSVSQQPAIPSQNSSSASQSAAQVSSSSTTGTPSPPAASTGRSYASATKKTAATTTQNPSASAGGVAHGKSDSNSLSNGKSSISPAVPAIGGPTIVNGNNAINSASYHSDHHSRKSSVTISALGTSGQMPNGGPVAGKPAAGNGIQFGSMNANASPSIANSTPNVTQTNSLAPANPRITSPATSPSPIPQPPASGGRPPSSLHGQGTGLSFGSMGGDDPSVSFNSFLIFRKR